MESQNYKDWVQQQVEERQLRDDQAVEEQRVRGLVQQYVRETQFNRDEFMQGSTTRTNAPSQRTNPLAAFNYET